MRLVEDPEETMAQDEWLRGGSALRLVEVHLARGERDYAAAVARIALANESCPDAERLEEVLEQCSDIPEEWYVTLEAFLAAPSVERWREIMQFVPLDDLYQRHRHGIRWLKKRGVDPDLLFLIACYLSITPGAIELVDEGRVKVATILKRAEIAGAARTAYVGLAAQAAYLGGDFIGTVRLLREAKACENEWCIAFPHIWFVRERASDAELEALDRAGLGLEE